MSEKKEPDILDEVKKIEKITKAQLLRKAVRKIKNYAREILELKEKTLIELEEIDIAKGEIKKVIDFVNSLPDVQLTENDKKELRDEVKKSVKEERSDVEKEVEKKGLDIFRYNNNENPDLVCTYSNPSPSIYSVGLYSSNSTETIKI